MQKSWVLRAATGIGHVIVEALLIILPKKSEGQTRTYRHMKLTFICPTGPCPAETSAASVQLKCTSRRIVTETWPIRNSGFLTKGVTSSNRLPNSRRTQLDLVEVPTTIATCK